MVDSFLATCTDTGQVSMNKRNLATENDNNRNIESPSEKSLLITQHGSDEYVLYSKVATDSSVVF